MLFIIWQGVQREDEGRFYLKSFRKLLLVIYQTIGFLLVKKKKNRQIIVLRLKFFILTLMLERFQDRVGSLSGAEGATERAVLEVETNFIQI